MISFHKREEGVNQNYIMGFTLPQEGSLFFYEILKMVTKAFIWLNGGGGRKENTANNLALKH